MPTGALWTVYVHNDGTNRIIDRIDFLPTTYATADLAASKVVVEKQIKKNDGSAHNHSWIVKFNYIAADIPVFTASSTFSAMMANVNSAISAAYGSAELSA